VKFWCLYPHTGKLTPWCKSHAAAITMTLLNKQKQRHAAEAKTIFNFIKTNHK